VNESYEETVEVSTRTNALYDFVEKTVYDVSKSVEEST